MKIKFFWLMTIFFAFCCAPLQAAEMPDQAGYTQKIPLNNIEVLSIVDNASNGSASIINDLNKHPEYAKLMGDKPFKSVFKVYLIKNGDKIILVDAGTGNFFKENAQMLNALAQNGIMPENITDILLTHMDFDHVGGLTANSKATFPNAVLHINDKEYKAWMAAQVKRKPEIINTVQEIVDQYKGKMSFFEPGNEVLPNIKAVDIAGHTPGHTAFDIDSGDQKMTIVGDLIHVHPIQLRYPEASSTYDMNAEQAGKARAQMLERLAREDRIVGGMHFPQVGKVKKAPEGGYIIENK